MTLLARLVWILLAALVFVFALFAVDQGQVALRFLAWQTPAVSVFWWLLLAFLLGALVTAAAFSTASLRHRMRQRALNRELQAAQRELERLRTSPDTSSTP